MGSFMRQLPAFLLEDAAGRAVSFPSGRATLICFVKEDCPTCGLVVPLLEAFHRAYGARSTSCSSGRRRTATRR